MNEIEQLTSEVLELKKHAAECASALADLGDRLRRARELLGPRKWVPWLRDHAGFSRWTARRYIQMADLRRTDPARFAEAAAEGPGAVYRVQRAPDRPPKPHECPPIRAATREDFARAMVGRVAEAAIQAARWGEFLGKMTPEAKGAALAAIEALRKEVLQWPAFVVARRA